MSLILPDNQSFAEMLEDYRLLDGLAIADVITQKDVEELCAYLAEEVAEWMDPQIQMNNF